MKLLKEAFFVSPNVITDAKKPQEPTPKRR